MVAVDDVVDVAFFLAIDTGFPMRERVIDTGYVARMYISKVSTADQDYQHAYYHVDVAPMIVTSPPQHRPNASNMEVF